MQHHYAFLFVMFFLTDSQANGRRCRPFKEFQCFWDGACIPSEMKCDRKPDCMHGEDETEWFAGCNPCSEKEFYCHKEYSFTPCINKDYTCDGFMDCFQGEDETYEFAKCKNNCKQDLPAALREGRSNCRKPCKSNKDCQPENCKPGDDCYNKQCICDYECGMSCVTVTNNCPPLDSFPHLRFIRYVQRNRKTKMVKDVSEPFTYDVHAYHMCEAGYDAVPNETRMCHGRGNNLWTREVACARSCPPKDDRLIAEYKMSCGATCTIDKDCETGKVCTCDGVCGRTCVNLNVECGDAFPAENAYIEYTGKNFDRVAHYICKEGYFTESGHVSRKCTGSKNYDGLVIKCAPVTCPDPVGSIRKTGGNVVNYQSPPYYFNTTFRFSCGSNQRLLGSVERTCMGDGKWSGITTVCDNIGSISRCPHPGVPVGGELLNPREDEDFLVGKQIQFRCNKGLVMVGEAQQICLFIKEWSGDGAPVCADPRFSDSKTDVINKIKMSVSNIRPIKQPIKTGRTITMSKGLKIEVYFVIDLSSCTGPAALKNTLDFAKALVKRLSLNDTDRVNYGIVVFASTAEVKLNILDEPVKTSEEVITILGDIERDVAKIRKKIYLGTNIQAALYMLDYRMLAYSYQMDPDKTTKRHIFVIDNAVKYAGGKPSDARSNIENAYNDNPPEFYLITSSADATDPLRREELQKVASKDENFVYIDDFYKMHSYIDQVTDVRENYNSCGQAGEVGSVRKMISRGRTIGGDDAVERAWPWQVLITTFDQYLLIAFDKVLGGGSLINTKWVLSAAHLFDHFSGIGWEKMVVLNFGIVRRPLKINRLQGSVRIYQPEKIYLHEEFSIYNGKPAVGTFQNDVALIKLGGEFGISPDGLFLTLPVVSSGYIEYSPYIRPVCLPCSPDSCVSKVLMKQDSRGKVLIKGDETPAEKCRIEYDFLMGKNKEGLVAVVATGFGHNTARNPDGGDRIQPTEMLQQAVLQIQERDKCKEAANIITERLSIPNFKKIFTDQMFCAVGSSDGQNGLRIVDMCTGDGGGPLVREVRDDVKKESCFVQLGIVSWGYGCGQATFVRGKRFFYPGFYTDVTSMMSWINNKMSKHPN